MLIPTLGIIAAPAPAQEINLTVNLYEREDGGYDSYLESDAGKRQVKVVINKLKKEGDI